MQPASTLSPTINPLTAGNTPTRRTTASSLLSSFKPRQSPTSASHLKKMSFANPRAERELRTRSAVTYVLPSDSEDSLAPSSPSDFFGSPHRVRRQFLDDDEEEDEEDEEDELAAPLPEDRSIEGGRALRPRSVLKARATSGVIFNKKRKYKVKKSNLTRKIARSQALSAREKVRDDIAKGTKLRQDRFLLAHKDFFVPLLQNGNYIEKLEAEHSDMQLPFVDYQDIPAQPDGVRASMKPYQLRGLSFLVHLYNNGMPGILGDEMGLGKTLQTLSLFQFLKEQDLRSGVPAGEARPFLVVCPLSVLSNWVAEARKFTPGLKVLRFHGPTSERAQMKNVALGRNPSARSRAKGAANMKLSSDIGQKGPYDLIVTTYEAYLAEVSWFKRAFVWRYLVLDEGHKIKNHATDVSKALQGIRAEYRLLLTGTPLQNNLAEMWSLLHWLLPNVFNESTQAIFKTSFDLSRGMVNKGVLDYSRRLLELVMLRRMKDSPGVDLNLPSKTEVRLFLPLTPLQKQWYTRLLTRQSGNILEEVFKGATDKEKDVIRDQTPEHSLTVPTSGAAPSTFHDAEDATEAVDSSFWEAGKETKDSTPGNKTQWQRLLNLVMQLRKCCTHPYLIPDAAPHPNIIGEHVALASGKFMALEKLIRELVMNQNKKILIFSNFTEVLDWTEDLLTYLSKFGTLFKHLRLDGSTKRARRNLHIHLFQNPTSEFKIMLISTKAGGLGLNLTAATEAIFLDEDWNPQVDLQAQARCHRIGQKLPVTIYKLCTQGTVEEQMLGRISKKLYLSARITDSMQSIHASSHADKKKGAQAEATEEQQAVFGNMNQLKSLLRRGAQTLVRNQIDIDEMASWDMATLLLKTQDKSAEAVTEEEQADEDKWLSTMEKVECAVFDGQRFDRKRPEDESSLLSSDVSREHRRKGKNTTVMIDGYAVSKDTVGNANWEAVATLAGKDPRLAAPKRAKKMIINNQEHCQICYDGGDIILCNGCPRSYHPGCLGKEEGRAALKSWQYYCPQHNCHDCLKKANEAGDMIFRCRWCQNGFCEDCLDWNNTTLVGDTLDEYKLLGFPAIDQAYYVVCSHCSEDPNVAAVWESNTEMYRELVKKQDEEQGVPTIIEPEEDTEEEHAVPGLTDAATSAYASEVSTPAEFNTLPIIPSVSKTKGNGSGRRKTKKKQKDRIYSFAEFDELEDEDDTEPLTTKGSRKVGRGSESMPGGTKRSFAELVDEFDEEEEEAGRKKWGRKKGGMGFSDL